MSAVLNDDLNPANRLGLDYRYEATRLPWPGKIWDIHSHINDLDAARIYMQAADAFGIERVWSMSQLEQVDALRELMGERISFIAVPNYFKEMDEPEFVRDWLWRIEQFGQKGVKVCKFWSAPRGRDTHPGTQLGRPGSMQAMKLAHELGMTFMTHVGDPDTWFATHYRDSSRYGTKMQQYEPLKRMLEMYSDVPWIAAHMGGDPEHLDHVQELLDMYPHLYLDTSATKWMVRELSKTPDAFRRFCQRNSGRILFGSDIVAGAKDMSFDLYASRYWALRTLMETDYDGPSPIVDPDLHMMDPSLPQKSTAHLRGCHLDPTTLGMIYRHAAQRLLDPGSADR